MAEPNCPVCQKFYANPNCDGKCHQCFVENYELPSEENALTRPLAEDILAIHNVRGNRISHKRKLETDVACVNFRERGYTTQKERYYAALLKLCTNPKQPWSVNRLARWLRRPTMLMFLTHEVEPLLQFFAREFAHDGEASSTFQCLIASQIVDRYRFRELYQKKRRQQDNGHLSGVANCYHGSDIIEVYDPSSRGWNTQPFDCYHGRNRDELIFTDSTYKMRADACVTFILIVESMPFNMQLPKELIVKIFNDCRIQEWAVDKESVLQECIAAINEGR